MKNNEKAFALSLEFVGAITLGLVIFATSGRTTFPFFGAFAAGLTYVGLLAAARPHYVSQLNPIVTFGLWAMRRLSTLRALVTVALQMLGGVVAWRLSEFFLDRPLQNIAGDQFDVRVFTAEAIGAFIFTYLLSFVIYKKPLDDAKLYIVAFVAIVLGMLAASLGDNGLINPSLAVSIQSWNWSYAFGPLVGGFVGMSLIPLIDSFTATTPKPKKKSATRRKTTAKKKK